MKTIVTVTNPNNGHEMNYFSQDTECAKRFASYYRSKSINGRKYSVSLKNL